LLGETVLYSKWLSYFRYRGWLTPQSRARSCFPSAAAWPPAALLPGPAELCSEAARSPLPMDPLQLPELAAALPLSHCPT